MDRSDSSHALPDPNENNYVYYQQPALPPQITYKDLEARGLISRNGADLYEDGMEIQSLFVSWCHSYESLLLRLIQRIPSANLSNGDLLDTITILEKLPKRPFVIRELTPEVAEAYEDTWTSMIYVDWWVWMDKVADKYEVLASLVEKRESGPLIGFRFWRDVADDFEASRQRMVVAEQLSKEALLTEISSLLPSPLEPLGADTQIQFGLASQLQETKLGGKR